MKKIIIANIIASVFGLMSPQISPAQGTIYLSNLGQPSTGSLAVGSDSWLAASFFTGNNAGGYSLDSVQLAMAAAAGNPSGFTVMIYANTSQTGSFPGNSLGTLTGSLNPVTSGIYTYIPASSLTLLPSTDYFIVLTAGTVVANGAYGWSYMDTASYNPVDNWGGGLALGSGNGSSWYPLGNYPEQLDYPQYAITATPVPEPSSLWLVGISGIAGVVFIKNRRKYFP